MLHFSKDGKSILLVPFCSLFWSQPAPNSQACGHQARTTETTCQGQVTDRPGRMLVKRTGQNDSLSAQHLEPDYGVRTSNLCSLCLSHTIMSSHGHRLDSWSCQPGKSSRKLGSQNVSGFPGSKMSGGQVCLTVSLIITRCLSTPPVQHSHASSRWHFLSSLALASDAGSWESLSSSYIDLQKADKGRAGGPSQDLVY